MVKEGYTCQAKSGYNGIFEDTEFIRAEKFYQFFLERAKMAPTSLFYEQISNERSLFRLMLNIDNVFILKQQDSGLLTSRSNI